MNFPKRHFYQEIKQSFDSEELRELSFELGIDPGELHDKTISTLAESFLKLTEKRRLLPQLIDLLTEKRTHIDWSELAYADVDCPYRGLLPFREQDAHLFYGRDAYIEPLLEAVDKQSPVAVIGPSGSGKSSVVFAGLVPRLRQTKQWQIVDFSPGQTPFATLTGELMPLLEPDLKEREQLSEANKLSEDLIKGKTSLHQVVDRITKKIGEDQRLLLIIDQFEELYTQTKDTTVQESFMKALLSLHNSKSVTILLTMRADFLGRALSYRPFADALQVANQMIGPMNRDELIEVIERPLSGTFVSFEPGLTTQILDDVGQEPGNLPLLEFALESLWQEQVDGKLTFAAYEKIDKVEGALTKHADDAYSIFEEKEEDALVRRLFVQLVQPVTGIVNTKRKAWRSELGDELWQLAAELADARLIVTNQDDKSGEDYIELAHEALISNWKRFDGWIKEDWEFRAWQERLRSNKRVWQEKDRSNGFLLQGSPLTVARDWLALRREDLSSEEIGYIDLSERKHKLDNYKRIIVGAVIIGFLIAASIVVAIIQSQAAESQRQARIDIGIEATKGALAQETAVAARETSEANAAALVDAVATSKVAEANAEQRANEAATAEAEAEASATEAERQARLANARWLVSQAATVFDEDPLLGLTLVLEGLALISPSSEDMSPDEFEAFQKNILGNSRQEVFQWGRINLLGDEVNSFSVNHDRLLIALQSGAFLGGTSDGTLEFRSPEDGSLINSFQDSIRYDLDPDGNRLLVNKVELIELWDLDTNTLLIDFNEVVDWEFSPDGDRLFVELGADQFGEPLGWRLLDLNGNVVGTGIDTNGSQTFSPTGEQFIVLNSSLGSFGTPQLYNSSDGSAIELSNLVEDQHNGVYFSPDGNRFILTGATQELRDAKTGDLIEVFEGLVRYELDQSAFSPDSSEVLIRFRDNTNELRNVIDGSLIKSFEGSEGRLEFSSDGNLFLIDYDDGTGEVRETASGEVIHTIDDVRQMTFSPNGRLLIVQANNSRSAIYDVANDFERAAEFTWGISEWEFSADGSRLMVKNTTGPWDLFRGYSGSNQEPLSWGSDISQASGDSDRVPLGGPTQGFSVSGGRFSPKGNFILISTSFPPGALLDADGNILYEFKDVFISNLGFSSDEKWVWIRYGDGTHELWHTSIDTPMAQLGADLVDAQFMPSAETMVIRYQDGRAYLIDLAWIEAMNGEVATVPVAKLVQLACQYALDNGAMFQNPDLLNGLRPFLNEVGLQSPQSCQNG